MGLDWMKIEGTLDQLTAALVYFFILFLFLFFLISNLGILA